MGNWVCGLEEGLAIHGPADTLWPRLGSLWVDSRTGWLPVAASIAEKPQTATHAGGSVAGPTPGLLRVPDGWSCPLS